jgi:hypothetical protein
MSNFSKDININKIIELIKSSKTEKTIRDRYSEYLKKIAMSQYKSYIDEQIKREEEEEEVQEQVQVQVQVQEREKKPYNFIPLPCITSYWPTIEYKLAYEKIIQLIIDNTRDEAEAQTYIENLKRIRKNCNKYIDTRYNELKELKKHTIIIQGRLRQPLQKQQEEQLRQQKWKEQQQQEWLQKEKERQEQKMSSKVLNYLEARARAEAREEGEAGEEEGGEEEGEEEGGEEEGGEEEGGEEGGEEEGGEEEAEARAKAGEEGGGNGGGKRKSKDKSKKVAKKPVVSQKKQSIYKEILGKQMKIYKMPDSRKEYVKYKGELLHISDYKSLMKQKAIAKTKATKVTKVTKVTKATKVTKQKAIAKTKTNATNATKATKVTKQKAKSKTKK